MNFLPSSSLFLGLSSTASVRRPHRETWESGEGTELDDVCSKLCLVSSPGLPVPGGAADAVPSGAKFDEATAHAAEAEAAEDIQKRAAEECMGDAPSNACTAVARPQEGFHEGCKGKEPSCSACAAPFSEAEAVPGRSSSSNVAWPPPAATNACSDLYLPRYDSASSLRRASSSFSTSLPTAPYERLLFQRQQQRRLMQQQATLTSLPTFDSKCGSSEILAAALEERHQNQEQLQQQRQQMQQQHEQLLKEAVQQETDAVESGHSPSRRAVVAELKGPSLSPALRLKLLREVMWSTSSTPNSSLGRSERKWWSMDDRNLEAFIVTHHRTFLRRLGRGVPPAYRWRAWQAVCAYHREMRHQEGSSGFPASVVYCEPSDAGKLREHLASLPESVDTAAFMEAFEGGNVCPKLYDLLAKHKSSYFNLILIDVPRTFPELAAVDRDAQGMLFRILNAFANLHVEVGYCQGMNFVAGLLLLVSAFNEFEAFSFFCFIMINQHLKEFFRERFPLLRKYIRAFDDMAMVHLPKLRKHFMDEGVLAPVYLHQWFLTLFITSLPLRSTLVVWDFFLARGLHAVLQLAVALLRVLARFLIQLKFEEIVKFLKSLKCSGGVDDFRIGKMLVKQAAKIQVPSHIMKEISPSNLEAIIREAELEEEEESRSRDAAFIAAAAVMENLPKLTPNPLAFVAESGNDRSGGEDGDLCKLAADGATLSVSGHRFAYSTSRDQAEEMVLIRASPPAEKISNAPDEHNSNSQNPYVVRPLFVRPSASCRTPDEQGDPHAVASKGDRAVPPSRSGSQSDASEEGAAAQVHRSKVYSSHAESRWAPEVASVGDTSAEATTPEYQDDIKIPELEEAQSVLVDGRFTSQEPESDEDGYELLEIANADRVDPVLSGEGSDGRKGGGDTGSCTSSALAEECERVAVREREGSFIDAITRLWLAGR